MIDNGSWRQINASRYLRRFQSRRSLLVWKLFGERLDGWSNADHPTESVPGNPATLPPGADPDGVGLLRVGVAVANSGLEPASLSVRADIAIGGHPAGTELGTLFAEAAPGVYEWALGAPLATGTEGHLVVAVADRQGNLTREDRSFHVPEPPSISALVATATLLAMRRQRVARGALRRRAACRALAR